MSEREERRSVRREVLRGALSDPDAEVRSAASRGLELLEAAANYAVLVERLTSKEIGERIESVYGLAALPEGRGALGIVTALRDPEVDVRVAAVRALGELRDERTMEPVSLALEDGSAYVRLAAVEALGAYGDRRLVPLMLVQLDIERDPEIVAAIVHAIGNAGDAIAEPRIMEYCVHGSSKVRAAAVEAIGRFESHSTD